MIHRRGKVSFKSQWLFQLSLKSKSSHFRMWLCIILCVQFSPVQLLSHVRLFATSWTAARQASMSITNSQSSLRLTSIESVMPSSRLILCHPLLLPLIPPSIRVFSNESTLLMRWPKYWSFSFSIIPSKEHPGMVSFRMDWVDLYVSVMKKAEDQAMSNRNRLKALLSSTGDSSCSKHEFCLDYKGKSLFGLAELGR